MRITGLEIHRWDILGGSSTSSTKLETNSISGGEKQRGIITYGLSANRQNPWAGAFHDAIFNTFRRTKGQIFYWLPPMVAGYYIMNWAVERFVYTQRPTTSKILTSAIEASTLTPRLVVPSSVMRRSKSVTLLEQNHGGCVGVGPLDSLYIINT
jgi:hypothetical protein